MKNEKLPQECLDVIDEMIRSEHKSIDLAKYMINIYDNNIAKDNEAIKEYRAGGHEMREFLEDWINYRKEDYKERNYWRRFLKDHERHLAVYELEKSQGEKRTATRMYELVLLYENSELDRYYTRLTGKGWPTSAKTADDALAEMQEYDPETFSQMPNNVVGYWAEEI